MKTMFVFQKICFKLKVLKTFETFTDCHIKTRQSLNRSATLKISITVFQKNYALSVSFKIKTLKKNKKKKLFRKIRQNQDKINNSSFAAKFNERSNHLFLLSIS